MSKEVTPEDFNSTNTTDKEFLLKEEESFPIGDIDKIAEIRQSEIDTKQKGITICWDTSLSMLERDLEKEFNIIDKLFQRHPNQTVQLLSFNVQVEEQEFTVVDGNWDALKQTLIAKKADGATIYTTLDGKIKSDEVYFFTDGQSIIPSDLIPVKKGNYVINSVSKRNVEVLEKSVLIGRGRLMDLEAVASQEISNELGGPSPAVLKPIKGTVYIDNVPSGEIEVRIKGSSKIYRTDTNGAFTVSAIPGDSIVVTSRLNKTIKTIPIGYLNKDLDVFLEANVTTLEEVIVTEKRLDAIAKEMVRTSIGLKNKESIGYAVQSIGEERITPINTDLNQVIQGKFSNVTLANDEDLTQFKGRANNTLLGNSYGLVVVDGVPIQQSDSSTGYRADATFINPDNVADITVLKGFAATNRYGTLGNGGVLLITTKTAKNKGAKSSPPNTALAKNNIYDASAVDTFQNSAITIALDKEPNLERAYEKYLDLRNFNEGNDVFYLDAFTFFKDKDKAVAARILSNFWERHPSDKTYLSIAEMGMRYLGMNEVSQLLNRQLNAQNPIALQPFFTEAKIKLAQGDQQEALNLLTTLVKGGNYGNLKVQPIQKSVERELKNLVYREKASLELTKVDEVYFKNTQMNVRILVEWNNPKAEFQIQFVNPQNRFFNWEHTNANDAARIREEIELGYVMEEFELYDDFKGDWTINANFIGNLDRQNKEPLILLFTVYKNFGYPSQTQEKVFIYLDYQNNTKNIVSLHIK